MVSLYKRASPAQWRILRIIEGAIINACQAHPDRDPIDERFARSIAKRAAGTISAQWPELLAAKDRPPVNGSFSADQRRATVGFQTCKARQKRGGDNLGRRPSLKKIRIQLGCLAREARKIGNEAREEAFVEALRIIADREKNKD